MHSPKKNSGTETDIWVINNTALCLPVFGMAPIHGHSVFKDSAAGAGLKRKKSGWKGSGVVVIVLKFEQSSLHD
jgi:hypothetical protein